MAAGSPALSAISRHGALGRDGGRIAGAFGDQHGGNPGRRHVEPAFGLGDMGPPFGQVGGLDGRGDNRDRTQQGERQSVHSGTSLPITEANGTGPK